MPIFRNTRFGMINHALLNSKIVHTKEDIIKILLEPPFGVNYLGVDCDEIKIYPFRNEVEIGWHTQIVKYESRFKELTKNNGVIGYLSEPLLDQGKSFKQIEENAMEIFETLADFRKAFSSVEHKLDRLLGEES